MTKLDIFETKYTIAIFLLIKKLVSAWPKMES